MDRWIFEFTQIPFLMYQYVITS